MAATARSLASRLSAASLALAGGIATVLLASPKAAEAVVITNGGVNYDVEIYNGSYAANPSYFATPANGGRMPWWGDQSLAAILADLLGAGLSPNPLPNDGPLFAWDLGNVTAGNVDADYLDLTTLGTSYLVTSGDYGPSTTQTYVVLVTPPPASAAVPAPLPLFGAAAAFGASRRLRRRLNGATHG